MAISHIAAPEAAHHLGIWAGAALGGVLGLLMGAVVVGIYTSSVSYNRRMMAQLTAGANHRRNAIMMVAWIIVPTIIGIILGILLEG